MLELRDLTKIYNAGTVTEMTLFDHFNLTVDDGQFVSIVGSNGSGKTSLLNILCGSIPLDGGDVLVGGKSIRKQKDFQRYATIGRVYQNPALGTCPNLTMLENMSLADNKGKRFGLGFGVNRKRIDFYRAELASLGLGLEDKLDVKMGALSGGQRQAVALLALIEQGRKAGAEYHGKKGHGQRGQEQNHGQDLHTHFTIFFRHWRMISSRDRVSTSTPFSAWATSALV